MARITYKDRLKAAVEDEDYEQAAIIRDEAKYMREMQKMIEARTLIALKKRTKAVEARLLKWDSEYTELHKCWTDLRARATR